MFEEALKEAIKYKIRLVPMLHPKSIASCVIPWIPFINVTGDVMPACHYFGDRTRSLIFGNIFKEDFRSIWNKETYKKHRNAARRGKSCWGCSWIDCVENTIF